jgi:hypothetical protein
VCLPRYPGVRPIVSLTLSGAECILPPPLLRRISRRACMRITLISGLTSSSGPSSRGAINRMSRVCRGRTTPLRRISAVLTHQPQVRALIPARVVEHQRQRQQLQLQPRLPLRPQQPLQLQRRQRQQLRQRLGRRLRRDLVPHRRQDRRVVRFGECEHSARPVRHWPDGSQSRACLTME